MRLPPLLLHPRLWLLSLFAVSFLGLGRWWWSREHGVEAAFTASIPDRLVAGRGDAAVHPEARLRTKGTTTALVALQFELAAARQELG